jgi:hypothetical protein
MTILLAITIAVAIIAVRADANPSRRGLNTDLCGSWSCGSRDTQHGSYRENA